MTQPSLAKIGAWRSLMHVHAAVTDAIDEALRAELGIPGAWYEALVEIALAGGMMNMQEFAAETTLTKSGATRFVDRLEKAGLVERRSCPTDRRIHHLALTEMGKDLQRAADPHVLRALEEKFASHISEEEAEVMLNALKRSRMANVPETGRPSSVTP